MSPSKGHVKSRLKAAFAPTACSAAPTVAPRAPGAECILERLLPLAPPSRRSSPVPQKLSPVKFRFRPIKFRAIEIALFPLMNPTTFDTASFDCSPISCAIRFGSLSLSPPCSEVVASKEDSLIYRSSRSNLCESPRLSRGFTYGNYLWNVFSTLKPCATAPDRLEKSAFELEKAVFTRPIGGDRGAIQRDCEYEVVKLVHGLTASV